MSKSAPPPRRGRSRRARKNTSQSSSSVQSIRDTSVPGPSASGKVIRPQQRDAGGRLVAQSNPAEQPTSGPTGSTDKTPRTTGAAFKSDSISSPPQGEVIHSADPPKPGNTVLAPKLEGTSVRVSQPGPSNVGANSSGMDVEDYFQ